MNKLILAALTGALLTAGVTFASADDRAAGAAVGAAAGAATGAVVGGPPGAAVGGAIGGTIGAGPSDPPPREVIIEERRPATTERHCVEDAVSKRCVEVTR